MTSSQRAMRNMTKQMIAQLEFLEKNLEKKANALQRTKRWLRYKLPGTRLMIKRQENGIEKVNTDIALITSRILKMQKEGKIFVIIE